MNETNNPPLPPPPGVTGALKAGLDVISTHLSVLLLPLGLDILLWLGPRLSVKDFLTGSYARFMDFFVTYGFPTAAQVDQMNRTQGNLADMLQSFNLFSLLRAFPVGVASLMQMKMPASTPLNALEPIEVGSSLSLFGWAFGLTLTGWILGGFYFNRVSALVGDPQVAKRPLRAIGQTLLLSVVFSILALMVGVPVMILLGILYQIDAVAMQVAFFAIAMVASWVIVPVFFAPHGIFLRGQNVIASIASSLHMARFTLPTSSMFVLAVFIISQGLNYLWSAPPGDSWMLLVGTLGHAFVATSLLAASFIYYRDMNAWLEIALERMKAAAPRQAL